MIRVERSSGDAASGGDKNAFISLFGKRYIRATRFCIHFRNLAVRSLSCLETGIEEFFNIKAGVMRFWIQFLIVSISLLLVPALIYGQAGAALTGVITDTSGAILPG